MSSRRRNRRLRIEAAIRFYLSAYHYGEWVSNTDIILHLEESMRGRKSVNSLSRESLGAYMRSMPDAERREVYDKGRRSVQYRILPKVGEEE